MAEQERIEIFTDRIERLGCTQCGTFMDVAGMEPFDMVTCPGCGVELPVPTRLGTFLLVKELGEGAMGAVYQAFDESLERNVAIKVMRRELGEDEVFVEKFLREARALARLNHPNVVQIYSCGTEKGQPYIVMELVAGTRLDLIMRQEEVLDEALALKIMIDVAKGLSAANEIELVHGDVKPQNILVDDKGTAKVVDFGLARFAGEQQDSEAIWGTPFYIAPETVTGHTLDLRSDMYSMGATFYHALTGQPPFYGKTVLEMVKARFEAPAPDIRMLRPDITVATGMIIARMLEQDPFLRYPTYDSLLTDMKRSFHGLMEDAEEKERRKAKRKQRDSSQALAVGITVVIVLGILATAGFLWWLQEEETKKTLPPPKKGVVKLVDGELVPTGKPLPEPGEEIAPEEPPQPDGEAAPPPATTQGKGVSITTSFGRGADAYIQGPSDPTYFGNTGFGNEEFAWVKAGADSPLRLARKIYLRFDISNITRDPVSEVKVKLTAAPAGKNANAGFYELMLWGIKEAGTAANWSEGVSLAGATATPAIDWKNAPANDMNSATDMTDGAVPLARAQVPAYPAVGEPIVFSNTNSVRPNKLIDFIVADTDDLLSFVITADATSRQMSGWKFATKENRHAVPPTLILEGPKLAE